MFYICDYMGLWLCSKIVVGVYNWTSIAAMDYGYVMVKFCR